MILWLNSVIFWCFVMCNLLKFSFSQWKQSHIVICHAITYSMQASFPQAIVFNFFGPSAPNCPLKLQNADWSIFVVCWANDCIAPGYLTWSDGGLLPAFINVMYMWYTWYWQLSIKVKHLSAAGLCARNKRCSPLRDVASQKRASVLCLDLAFELNMQN